MVFKTELLLILGMLFSTLAPSANAADPPTYDYECMVTTIWFEARGEPVLGQRWVFDVVRNRAELKYRGKSTVCDVIYDPKQFSFANRDKGIRPRPLTEKAEKLFAELEDRVAYWMFGDYHIDVTCGATHYLRYDYISRNKWARQAMEGKSDENLVFLTRIGDHAFFGPKQECNFWVRYGRS